MADSSAGYDPPTWGTCSLCGWEGLTGLPASECPVCAGRWRRLWVDVKGEEATG